MKSISSSWFNRKKDELQPLVDEKYSSNPRKTSSYILATIIVGQILVISGLSQGYTAILLAQLESPDSLIKIDVDQASWIASLGLIWQPFSAALTGYTSDKYGRKRTMQAICIVVIVAWMLMLFSNGIYAIYASRSLLCVLGTPSPGIYLNEVSKATYRGTIVSIIEPCLSVGTLAAYVLGYELNWKTVAALLSVYSFTIFCAFFVVPESFVWYIANGKKTEAIESMSFFEKNARLVEDEINALEAKMKTVVWKKNYLYVFQNRTLRKRLIKYLIFIVIQQMIGTLTIINYAIDFFNSLNTSYNGNVLSIIFGSIAFASGLIVPLIAHKFNRKTIIKFSGIGMSIFMGIAAASFSLSNSSINKTITLVCIFIYVSFSRMGILILSSTVCDESFPTKARGTVSATRHVVGFITAAICLKCYPLFSSIVSVEGVLWYLAILPFMAVLYVIAFFDETKDRTIVDMEDI